MESIEQPNLSNQDNRAQTYEIGPFLKWVGGKSKFIQEIIPYIPNEYDTYYEPFIGGGSLFFYLKPQKAYISDINIELVNCYQVIKNDVSALLKNLESKKDKTSDIAYYVFRASFNNLKKENEFSFDDVQTMNLEENEKKTLQQTCIEKASLFIYLNKTCFRGIYRENKKGEMNVPYGHYSRPSLFDSNNLKSISKYFNECEIQIHHHSYKFIQPTRQDFVYFDPPYDQVKTTDFVAYNKEKFKQEDLFKFIDLRINAKGVSFVLSNAPTDYIKNTYKDYQQRILSGKRSVDVKKVKTVKDIEIIISSN